VDALPARIPLAEALTLAGRALAPTELPIAVGGDEVGLFCLDGIHHGPGLLIAGPRRSGRSTALTVMAASALARGWPVAVITPRVSPLRDLQGRPGLVGCWGADADKEQVSAGLAALGPRPGSGPSLLLIDDLDVLGPDGWLPDLITDYLATLRDTGSMVAAAGALEELTSMYRGPVVAIKRSRSGLLLAPQNPNDGDLFGIRVPRSGAGAGPAGRGLLIRSGEWEPAQVPYVSVAELPA
jgi:S-DNA-T family DNA segregation ATPase FtsK/SpoIIIE